MKSKTVNIEQVYQVMRENKCPVLTAGLIAHKIRPYPYHASHNPVYRDVLRKLWKMQSAGKVGTVSTEMNQRVWWLKERLS